MSTIVLLLLFAAAVLVVAGGAYVGLRVRDKAVELEPPATRRAAPQVTPPEPVEAEGDGATVEVAEPPPGVEAEPEVLAKPTLPRPPGQGPRRRGGLRRARSCPGRRSTHETWDELEEALIRADVGVGPTTELLDALRSRVKAEGITDAAELLDALQGRHGHAPRRADRDAAPRRRRRANVWLFVGRQRRRQDHHHRQARQARDRRAGGTVVMAAGDTFRAAAAEQLGTWAERAGADFVRGAEGGDPSSVIFDAVERGLGHGAPTSCSPTPPAGCTPRSTSWTSCARCAAWPTRAPARSPRCCSCSTPPPARTASRRPAVHRRPSSVTGVVLTKLDGSAKGGIVLAIQSQLGIPVKLVGLGETADDLVDFDADEFVDALFSRSATVDPIAPCGLEAAWCHLSS